MTRKEFINATAGAAALAAISASGAALASCSQLESTGKPKRGVSIYSWTDYGELNVSMTLEDCFQEIYGTGAHGLEILSSYIHGYPNPTDEWIEWWFSMMKKYELVPVEFGHFVDSMLYAPPRKVTAQESYDMLVSDLKLANKLGFITTRTRIGMHPEKADMLVDGWQEWVERALPVAEELNIKICCELHRPTPLNGGMVEECLNLINKTGTKNFGFNVDFGEFMTGQAPESDPYSREGQEQAERQRQRAAQQQQAGGMQANTRPSAPINKPEDIIPLLPYTYCCHAKFQNVNEDCEDTTTPYPEIIDIMIKHNWDGYLLSEYEGPNKDVPGYTSTQIRRQHVLLKRLLGA